MLRFIFAFIAVFFATTAIAFEQTTKSNILDLTTSPVGYIALIIFVVAYVFVILEEKIHLRKSKPVLAAAGIIWILIAISYQHSPDKHLVEQAIRHNFLEYSELFFFLLVAMTYINAMLERRI